MAKDVVKQDHEFLIFGICKPQTLRRGGVIYKIVGKAQPASPVSNPYFAEYSSPERR
jgi:hypothetical protein